MRIDEYSIRGKYAPDLVEGTRGRPGESTAAAAEGGDASDLSLLALALSGANRPDGVEQVRLAVANRSYTVAAEQVARKIVDYYLAA